MILTPEQVAEMGERYELPDSDPLCTCRQVDVDVVDPRGCEMHYTYSDYNKRERHVKHELEYRGLQDIGALQRSHEELRADRDRLLGVIADVIGQIERVAA